MPYNLQLSPRGSSSWLEDARKRLRRHFERFLGLVFWRSYHRHHFGGLSLSSTSDLNDSDSVSDSRKIGSEMEIDSVLGLKKDFTEGNLFS